MTIDSVVMFFAGSIVLIGVALTYFVSPWGLILPAFVGCNLIQAAFTGFCPVAKLFKKFGFKVGPAFNP